jgi:ribosome biogenesis protein ENP2
MHGYFLSLKLYDAARVIANPFVYSEHREKTIRQKVEKLAESRIRTKKDNLPKVNKALAERIMKNAEREKKRKRSKMEEGAAANDTEVKEKNAGGLLQDSRFKAVFEDPEFQIDETSKEFALLHPSQADATSRGKKTRTAVDSEESSDGGMSSDDLGITGGQSSESKIEEDDESEDSSEGECIN